MIYRHNPRGITYLTFRRYLDKILKKIRVFKEKMSPTNITVLRQVDVLQIIKPPSKSVIRSNYPLFRDRFGYR